MKTFKIAILGCGTVGGGSAKILLEQEKALEGQAGARLELARIVDLFPAASAERHGIQRSRYCGNADEITPVEAASHIEKIVADPDIDLVVETIGGSGDAIRDIVLSALKSGKHVVTANKALLAKHGKVLFGTAAECKRALGFEAAVCGAIPIIRGISECFTGDEIQSISGIMNGTSNFVLSKMEMDGQSFEDALRAAQAAGYAEADPTLDIDGSDAGHKLVILLRLAFGLDVSLDEIGVRGVDSITATDTAFADEMGCSVKLIGYATRIGHDVFATVRPMLVKRSNLLSSVQGATNAVRLVNRYSAENVLVGQGAGSLETGSAIVSDIVFIARYGERALRRLGTSRCRYRPFSELSFRYNVTFETADSPGITGIITTAIGAQGINIDTVSHNRHDNDDAVFAVATMPCTQKQIDLALDSIRTHHPKVMLGEPKVIPILAE